MRKRSEERRNAADETREREAFERRTFEGEEAHLRLEGDGWIEALGWVGLVMVVLVAAGIVMSGCGAEKSGTTEKVAGTVSMAPAAGTAALPASAPAGAPAGEVAAQVESMPPDLEVSVPDTLVTPGEAIDITARATDDVREMALADGRDEPSAFYLDEASNTWKARYRVPLHPRSERLGLSVTAKNDARWRRVWVFLHVQSPAAQAAADTTGASGAPESGH